MTVVGKVNSVAPQLSRKLLSSASGSLSINKNKGNLEIRLQNHRDSNCSSWLQRFNASNRNCQRGNTWKLAQDRTSTGKEHLCDMSLNEK